MDSKIYLFTIEKAEIIKSKFFNRYGLKFLLSYKNQEKIFFEHIFWFGNYKDFNKDKLNKSALIWELTLTRFMQMGLPEKGYEKPETLIGISFSGTLELNSDGVILNKIYKNSEE